MRWNGDFNKSLIITREIPSDMFYIYIIIWMLNGNRLGGVGSELL